MTQVGVCSLGMYGSFSKVIPHYFLVLMLTLALSEPQRLKIFLHLLELRATLTISVSFYG